jgi:hypothetical protein
VSGLYPQRAELSPEKIAAEVKAFCAQRYRWQDFSSSYAWDRNAIVLTSLGGAELGSVPVTHIVDLGVELGTRRCLECAIEGCDAELPRLACMLVTVPHPARPGRFETLRVCKAHEVGHGHVTPGVLLELAASAQRKGLLP